MRILVTGAAGFLGRHVVGALRARGYTVRALARPAFDPRGLEAALGLEVVRLDLRSAAGELETALAGVDVVVHLAAAMTGDPGQQEAVTVGGSARLFEAMARAGCRRLVLASSLAVYDWHSAQEVLDERTALIDPEGGGGRDAYAMAKARQEAMARRRARELGWELTVLRPGFIWGPGRTTIAGVGPHVGPIHLVVEPGRVLPLTYVENCAQAFALACERREAAGHALNVVDDQGVSARRYLGDQLATSGLTGLCLPVPYALGRWAVGLVHAAAGCLPAVRTRLPSILVPLRFEARFKPVRITSDAARALLGWEPRWTYAECWDRARRAASADASRGPGT